MRELGEAQPRPPGTHEDRRCSSRLCPTRTSRGNLIADRDKQVAAFCELFADMLLAQGRPADALNQYQASLDAAPQRLRGFYGAAKAAESAGKKRLAAVYWQKLAILTQGADSDRTELREIKQRVARR